MKKHMRVNWTRWHEKCTWNLSHWVIHNWPSSKICKLFTPYLQVIQLMLKKKRQKKQQCLRSLRSLFAFGPKSTSVPKRVAIRATDRPGSQRCHQFGGGMDESDEWPGRIWISIVFIGILYGQSGWCDWQRLQVRFGCFFGGVGLRQIILDSDHNIS